MEAFAAYGHAIVAMAGLAFLTLLLSPLTAVRKTAAGLAPGAQPDASYASPIYRLHRAHGNLTEATGSFALVTVAAILAGASPLWVNWLASLYLVSRVVLAVVHVAGLGRPDMSLRSVVYVFGWVISMVLAVMAIVAAF
ncbi:MAPEG family protein [Roseovarius spongiae]|uniref:MAPEG family protein n=1 Tax=Roseovarius spongiae TaxID=2320272 RepID=A0A3A8B5L0_9RHOB|nr:MAPEG family protein [Roseovarius spongiae]RKF15006.1 MAPEG family protein [Roseovarius spongiae]